MCSEQRELSLIMNKVRHIKEIKSEEKADCTVYKAVNDRLMFKAK